MMNVKSIKLWALLFLLSPMVAFSKSMPSFLSYNEWKTSMVQSAELKYKTTQLNIKKIQEAQKTPQSTRSNGVADRVAANNLKNLIQQAKKESSQLSVTKDLTISDYFVGYLTKQPDMKTAIEHVSQKMTSKEISELMQAYADNFFDSTPTLKTPLKSATRAGFNQ